MLNQHEFKERYIFISQRIANGLSRPDLAFLLGKSTYDVTDYEHLCGQVRMNFKDYEVMATLYKNSAPAAPVFYTQANNIDISGERRMIRGTVTERAREWQIEFLHPWKIKGENKPIAICGDLHRPAEQDSKITELVIEYLLSLKKTGYFQHGCTAFQLYHQLNNTKAKHWQPRCLTVLRQTVYAHVHSGEFQIHQQNGQLFYQLKK